MSDNLSHCMCGCIYEELECPNCNKVTDKDRIEELESKLSLRTNLHEECIYLLKSTEAKLAEAVEALGEAIYLLDPDEEDIAKETGLHRIVTTYAELTGGKDDNS